MSEQIHKKDNSFDKIIPRKNRHSPAFKKYKTFRIKKQNVNGSTNNSSNQTIDHTFTIIPKENSFNLESQNQNPNIKTFQVNNININNYYNTINSPNSNNSKISYFKYKHYYSNNSDNIPIQYSNPNNVLLSPNKYETSQYSFTERSTISEEEKKLLEIMKIQEQNFSRPPFSNKQISKKRTIIKQKLTEFSNINNKNFEDSKRYERKTFNAKHKLNIIMDEDFTLNNNNKKINNKNIEQYNFRKSGTNLSNYEKLSIQFSNKNNNVAQDYVNDYENINNNNFSEKLNNINTSNLRYHSISIKDPNIENLYKNNNIRNTNLDRFTKNYKFFRSPQKIEKNIESSKNNEFFGKNKTFEICSNNLTEMKNKSIKNLQKNSNGEYINKTVIVNNVNNRNNHSLFESKNFKKSPNSKKILKYIKEKSKIINKTLDDNAKIDLGEESLDNNCQNSVRKKGDNLSFDNQEKNIFIKKQDITLKNCINNSLRYNKEKTKENNLIDNTINNNSFNSSNNLFNRNNTIETLPKNIKATKTNVIIRKNKTEKKIKRNKLNKTNIPAKNTQIFINHEIHITINKLTKENNKNNNNNDNTNNEKINNIVNNTNNNNMNKNKIINNNTIINNNEIIDSNNNNIIINNNKINDNNNTTTNNNTIIDNNTTKNNANINSNTNFAKKTKKKTKKNITLETNNIKKSNIKLANKNNPEITKNIKTITNSPRNVIQNIPQTQNDMEKSNTNLNQTNNLNSHNILNDSNDSNSSQDDKKPDYNNDDLSNIEEMPKMIKPVIQHSIQRKRPVYTLPPSKKRSSSQGKSLNIIHKYYDENFILEDDEEEEACFIRNKDGEVESKRASRRVCENVDENN